MIFGLVGKSLQHSFSKHYFEKKWNHLQLPHSYQLFEFDNVDAIKKQLNNLPNLRGLNVTIPYKTSIIQYLDGISDEAKNIGAINCISIENGKWTGHNTDAAAFYKTLPNPNFIKKILVLGNGGAAKAVIYYLLKNKNNITQAARNIFNIADTSFDCVKQINWLELDSHSLLDYDLIINATPLGMRPDDAAFPLLYTTANKHSLFYDLIYNPAETTFLLLAKIHGCKTKNGLEMLHLQADKSWEIWKKVCL